MLHTPRRDPSSGAVKCQHGKLECAYNVVLACAMHLYEGLEAWYP